MANYKPLAIILVVVVIAIGIGSFLLLSNGGGEEEKTGLEGEYILKNCVTANIEGGEIVFDESYDELHKRFFISSVKKDTIIATWGEDKIVGVYDNGSIRMSMTTAIDSNAYDRAEDIIYGTINNGILTIYGLSYGLDVSMQTIDKGYEYVFVKTGTSKDPKDYNPFLNVNDALYSFDGYVNNCGNTKQTGVGAEAVSLTVKERHAMVYKLAYQADGKTKYTVGIQYSSDSMLLDINNDVSRLHKEGDLAMLMTNSCTTNTKVAATYLMSPDGKTIEIKEKMPAIEGVTLKGEHITVTNTDKVVINTDSTMLGTRYGNIIEIVTAQEGTVLMQFYPCSDGYEIFYNNYFLNGGVKTGCTISGHMSADLKKVTLCTSTHRVNGNFTASKMNYEQVDSKQGMYGIYVASEKTTITESDEPVVSKLLSYDNYFTIDSISSDGIVNGSLYGLRFVGTYNGESIDFIYYNPNDYGAAFKYSATFENNVCVLKGYGQVNVKDPITGEIEKKTSASYSVFQKCGSTTEKIAPPKSVFEEGESYTSYECIVSKDVTISKYAKVECIKNTGCLYAVSVTWGGNTWLMNGYGMGSNGIIYLIDDENNYYTLNIHEKIACLETTYVDSNVPVNVIWRMTTDGSTGELPSLPTAPTGKYEGSYIACVSKRQAATETVKENSHMEFKTGKKAATQMNIVTALDNVFGHVLSKNDKEFYVTFMSYYYDEGLSCDMYYKCLFSSDGKSVVVTGHGWNYDGRVVSVIYHLNLV